VKWRNVKEPNIFFKSNPLLDENIYNLFMSASCKDDFVEFGEINFLFLSWESVLSSPCNVDVFDLSRV